MEEGKAALTESDAQVLLDELEFLQKELATAQEVGACTSRGAAVLGREGCLRCLHASRVDATCDPALRACPQPPTPPGSLGQAAADAQFVAEGGVLPVKPLFDDPFKR